MDLKRESTMFITYMTRAVAKLLRRIKKPLSSSGTHKAKKKIEATENNID